MAWPPLSREVIERDIREAGVWYEGDDRELMAFYGADGGRPARPSDRATRTGLLNRVRFWARRSDDQATDRQRIHVPAAADVAATSADLLFGDAPRLIIPEAHEFDTTDDDPEAEPTDPTPQGDAAAMATEERLNELAELDGWGSKLLDAAEIASALGGVYLRPVWDEAVAGHPMLDIVHPDHAVPEFRWGRLVAVTFWRVIETTGTKEVVRHLTRHEPGPEGGPGLILHGVYVGTERALGTQVGLDKYADTNGLKPVVTLPPGIRFDVRYVQNALNRRLRLATAEGRADAAGTWALHDALDETMTSWMRDIRLGQGRIIVPDEFLTRRGRGQGATFDKDAEVFSPLTMDPANMEKAGITVSQFAIRTQEHFDLSTFLFERIVTSSGFSPQSFGMKGDGGALKTATQVSSEDSKSVRTTGRKQGHWRTNFEDFAEMALIIDAVMFKSGVEPMRPRLVFAEPDAADPTEIGPTLAAISAARAASTETLVRMLHRDWDDPEVQDEVRRINEEQGLGNIPDPVEGFGA
jgi:hypothetical protein